MKSSEGEVEKRWGERNFVLKLQHSGWYEKWNTRIKWEKKITPVKC